MNRSEGSIIGPPKKQLISATVDTLITALSSLNHQNIYVNYTRECV